MSYTITRYTKQKAEELGVKVLPSTNPKKKIDVYIDDEKVASVGAIGYYDFPTYMLEYGKEYANEKRRLYKMRHEKDRHVVGSNGWFADQLLW